MTSRTRAEKCSARSTHSWIAGKELSVPAQRGPAARSIDDVDVGSALLERSDVALGQLARKVAIAGVNRDGAAAALFCGDGYREPAAREHA